MKPSIELFLLLLFMQLTIIGALQVFKDLSLSLTIKKGVLMMMARRPPGSGMSSFIVLFIPTTFRNNFYFVCILGY